MSEGIITVEQMRADPLLKATIIDNAEKCNLDVDKVYDKLLDIFVDYNDVGYVNKRLPQMMSDFIFGYLMCYNPHVKYKCHSILEKS